MMGSGEKLICTSTDVRLTEPQRATPSCPTQHRLHPAESRSTHTCAAQCSGCQQRAPSFSVCKELLVLHQIFLYSG